MIKLSKIVVFVLAIVFALTSCGDNSPIKKPKKLIKERKMIDMLTDMHMAESMFNHFRYDSAYKNVSSSVFYYSVLDKYQVPDSVFEKSFVYYASSPKKFERMYRKVMNKLSETEQEYNGRKTDPLEFKDPRERK